MDSDPKALFKLFSPPKGWANQSDCGEFTCTGLYQSLLRMEETEYTGSPVAQSLPAKFEVTANNKESTSMQAVPECIKKPEWNAYLC